MSGALSQIRAPIIPDFYVCDAAYGQNLLTPDCSLALDKFRVRYPRSSYSSRDFPLETSGGTCCLTVELAGPSAPSVIPLTGADGYSINQAAAWIAAHCVLASNGIGGFVTMGTLRLQAYAMNSQADYWHTPFPATTYFMTVTLSGPPGQKQPGDYDPSVATALSNRFRTWLRERGAEDKNSDLYSQRERIADIWEIQSIRMTRGGSSIPWYQLDLSVTDEMAYECDANLGSPLEVDCAQIEWSQLYPTSDTVTVTPAAVKFFHHNSCSLALSTLTPTTLTWNQIRIALANLLNLCVQNPTQASQGGRAYATPPRRVSISGGKEKKKKRYNIPNGLNALPPSVNMTIFQQVEPWPTTSSGDDASLIEMDTCTWRAVTGGGGGSVNQCK